MDMMLKMMPKVASEIAEPLSKANKITMISDGSGDIGAAKLTGEILAIMGSIPETVTKMTGVNIAKQLSERRNWTKTTTNNNKNLEEAANFDRCQ